jgi:hypothetical protein
MASLGCDDYEGGGGGAGPRCQDYPPQSNLGSLILYRFDPKILSASFDVLLFLCILKYHFPIDFTLYSRAFPLS